MSVLFIIKNFSGSSPITYSHSKCRVVTPANHLIMRLPISLRPKQLFVSFCRFTSSPDLLLQRSVGMGKGTGFEMDERHVTSGPSALCSLTDYFKDKFSRWCITHASDMIWIWPHVMTHAGPCEKHFLHCPYQKLKIWNTYQELHEWFPAIHMEAFQNMGRSIKNLCEKEKWHRDTAADVYSAFTATLWGPLGLCPSPCI